MITLVIVQYVRVLSWEAERNYWTLDKEITLTAVLLFVETTLV